MNRPHSTRVLLVGICWLVGLTGCGSDGGWHPVVEPTLWWGQPGVSDGRFSSPRSVAVDSCGLVYVGDKTGRIQVFDPEGNFVRGWRLPAWENGTPTGSAFSPDDRLYLADTHYGRILVYSREGDLLDQWGEFGEQPGSFSFVTDVWVAPDGRVFTSEYGGTERIQCFEPDGTLIRSWGSFGQGAGQFSRIMALAGTHETILALDAVNECIQVFSLAGAFKSLWGESGREPGQLNYPYDFCLDEEDRVWVVEYGRNRFQRFGRDGQWQGAWGQTGREPGQFVTPWGIATAPGGRVYVADTGNHRVQAFDF